MDAMKSKALSLPSSLMQFDLRRSQLVLEDNELSHGSLGTVRKGICLKEDKKRLSVAVKILQNEDKSGALEMINEATVMSKLSNPHVIQMIGVCTHEGFMLVFELAPLGSLRSFLSVHKKFPQKNIVELMIQVAKGMTYVSSQNIVHRDLATRSVLLCDEQTAKISDFSMSVTMGSNGYYEAPEAGIWPLKWYPPECVYYWKFDSKSDVWSYGVTLWEAMSYADKPYGKMKGQQVLDFIEQGNRLAKPAECDEEVYLIMMMCWEYNNTDRPTFADIVKKLERLKTISED